MENMTPLESTHVGRSTRWCYFQNWNKNISLRLKSLKWTWRLNSTERRTDKDPDKGERQWKVRVLLGSESCALGRWYLEFERPRSSDLWLMVEAWSYVWSTLNIGCLINVLAPFGERQTVNKMFDHPPGQLQLLPLFDLSPSSQQWGVTAVFL